ncbi:MAG: Unknown protein [uncultured Campylobacterales bacterium]|uniref:Inner membrane protein YgaP-like transmembrane domain-containing protein n=1 Tax=uncultured Campylobacterales bacterium TaxID=352960 RepID=A0A6S6S8S5_9BACT|nr:MAG: Unknown protein [uncultured Campylobacterales bacterium]
MTCNVGGIDRKIRIILGVILVLVGIYFVDARGEFTTGVIIQVVGAIIFASGIFYCCLIYKLLGKSTYIGKESCCLSKKSCDKK